MRVSVMDSLAARARRAAVWALCRSDLTSDAARSRFAQLEFF